MKNFLNLMAHARTYVRNGTKHPNAFAVRLAGSADVLCVSARVRVAAGLAIGEPKEESSRRLVHWNRECSEDDFPIRIVTTAKNVPRSRFTLDLGTTLNLRMFLDCLPQCG